jgi:hypothetical protein
LEAAPQKRLAPSLTVPAHPAGTAFSKDLDGSPQSLRFILFQNIKKCWGFYFFLKSKDPGVQENES